MIFNGITSSVCCTCALLVFRCWALVVCLNIVMEGIPKVGDIDDEDNLLRTKIKLTKNEYNATIRNKLEYNRLKVVKRHLDSQSDLNGCKMRTSIQDMKKWLNGNQTVICNIDEFFTNRKAQSAAAGYRSRPSGVRSSLSRNEADRLRIRPKSVSTISRPYTAPLQTFYERQNDLESDDEIIPMPLSRLTSGKYSIDRVSSAISSSVLSQHPPDPVIAPEPTPPPVPPPPALPSFVAHRITWPVKLKVFALQDENEARKQFLAWRAEQRKTKVRRPSKTFYDKELEEKYQQSIRRRQEIEDYVTPELIQEHKLEDPIFAKRFRQLKLAVRAGKIPTYDPNDREINVKMTKSKIERERSALITAKQSKIQTFYRNQQNLHDRNLNDRIQTFLNRIKSIKKEQEQNV